MSSSEIGIFSWMPNHFHCFKILTATWFRKSRADTGLVNTVLSCSAGLSGGCEGKGPVWLVERPIDIHQKCMYNIHGPIHVSTHSYINQNLTK